MRLFFVTVEYNYLGVNYVKENVCKKDLSSIILSFDITSTISFP